jgi:glycerophosphoryl diester phosphodiesterase
VIGAGTTRIGATIGTMVATTAKRISTCRPYYLVEKMAEGKLKRKLKSCSEGPFAKTDFSIVHRGAALQFPEHTKESYEAAARMGAGIPECDVTFTQDGELVCRLR